VGRILPNPPWASSENFAKRAEKSKPEQPLTTLPTACDVARHRQRMRTLRLSPEPRKGRREKYFRGVTKR
ncbi:hypothetical protein, partial [Billgrantia desiderata]|uniref:hypothetical protein n=1 Tax=Billgrantia desiderata TaxID=52021 RepID=UPI0028A2027C